MIILNKTNDLVVSRVDRCKNDPCNIYQLILQNKATKDIVIFKVRDYASINPVYYQFRFNMPEWFKYGEYDAYLVRSNNWIPDELDEDYIKGSTVITNKSAIANKDMMFISEGMLVVTKLFKAKISDATDSSVKGGGFEIVGYAESDDNRATGDIWTYLDIIFADLAKYSEQERASKFIEPSRSRVKKEYVEHNRRRI